jgi:ketosteroid isomerase-like protein
MMGTDSLVRGLYEAYQDRDWERAASLLHRDAVLEMPATAERLVGREAIVSFQRSYPEPWGTLTVEQVLVDIDATAAQVSIVDPSTRRAVASASPPSGVRTRSCSTPASSTG